MRKKGKGFVQEIALERIYRLFELAEQEFEAHPERSRRYVQLARAIGSRNNATIPKELKKKFCRKCGAFLKHGKNAKLRVSNGLIVVSCAECGSSRKFGTGKLPAD